MCGLAGAVLARDAEPVTRRMTCAIEHRGPDDSRVAVLPGARGEVIAALGHARLSIIDLSPTGAQPMASADGRYTLIYNGEIYNYRALRAELEDAGERFHGDSDTEVLLRGWAREGSAYLARLRGMFAFALWDRERSTLSLARDGFGIKPLYLARVEGGVIFGSEVRALLASGRVPHRLSPAAVASFLAAGSVMEPYAAVEGVESIPPGTVVEVRAASAGVELSTPREFAPRYPRVDPAAVERDPAAARAKVRAALRDSVAHHLVSDVPIAFFLSGGIDSSAVVALAAELQQGALETFTVVFAEKEFSEAGPARIVAERFGTRHHEVHLSGADLLAQLPAAFAAMDQPSMDGLNTYAVSGAVHAAGIKVVLSGLGGDELFAGYPSFRRASLLARLPRAALPLRRMVAATAGRLGNGRGEKLAVLLGERDPAVGAYEASRSLFSGRQVQSLVGRASPGSLPPAPAGLSLLQRVSWYELNGYMLNTLLRDSDVFSMAHSLELRVPFVDREVYAASAAVDDSLKLAGRSSKPLLVAAVEDLLPPEVWDRPKQGFALPFDRWMRGPLRAEIAAAFTPERVARVGVSVDAARDIWQGFLASRGIGWSRPWALYTLVRWAEENSLSVEPAADVERVRAALAVG